MDGNNDSIGFLVTNVRTANGSIPVENALVYVYGNAQLDENGAPTIGKTDVIYSLRTNESGQTERVALETKPRELSQEPGTPTPYLTYNIAISADGYYNQENINVPIFQGITSIQNAELIPLAEYATPDSYNPESGRRFVETPDTEL